jgi:3-carboxy-cis,cis-muconate cycloisomerase
MTSELFSPLFVPDVMREAVSDRAWVQAMLDVEAALAAAQAEAGLIPGEAAAAIATSCSADRFDCAELGRASRGAGNAVVPLVERLSGEVAGDAARYVHWGATSQDVLDTAAMLIARRALALVVTDLDRVAHACAVLAGSHRGTLMAGRSLLQQALPTTFGLKSAGWLVGVVEARRTLVSGSAELAVELGGAAGTLGAFGGDGVAVVGHLARELDLAEPVVPWHTGRSRIAQLGSSLAIASGALAKIAVDIALLSQTEVGEVAEPAEPGRGGSSTMPHKRNPVGATLARACARRVHGLAGVLLAAMEQEHERAAGAWHSEWEPLRDCLALTGGAASWVAEVLEGLEVNPERMRRNLELTGGMLLTERVSMLLAGRIGRLEANRVVKEATARAAGAGRTLRDELVADEVVTRELSAGEVDAALDPGGYLGSADAFVTRALELYRREVKRS